MPITIKYNTSTELRALKKSNIWIGIDGEKGPSENTGFWNGISPIPGGWTIYNRRGESELFDIYTASNDDLVYKTNWIFGTTFSTNGECQIHYAGSFDRMVLRREPSSITTEGLVLFLDPNFSASYPAAGSTFYDMSGVGGDATLFGSPTFEENSDTTNSIVLNGENQTLDLFGNFSGSINSVFTWVGWYYVDNPSKSDRQVLFGNRESGTDPGFCICVNSLGENDNLFYVEWYDEDYGSLTHSSITPGSWIFGAFTANRGGEGSLWINNSSVSGTVGNFDLTPFLNSGKWFIGGEANYLFKGKVGLNVLYNRILSVDEVSSIYQTTRVIYDLEPSPSVTPTNTPTNTQTPSITPTNTPTNTASNTQTPTQTPTNTASPTNTPSYTPTNTPSKTPGIDPDADNFINTVGGLSGTEQTAINNLVSSLKSNNIWPGLTAFYPFVGDTADQMKYNLINPQNTNAAYRLTFNGGWSYSKSGLKGNGSDTYAQTHYSARKGVIDPGGGLSFSIGFNGFGAHILDKANLVASCVMGTDGQTDIQNQMFMEGPCSVGITSSLCVNFYPGNVGGVFNVTNGDKRFSQHMASMKIDGFTSGNIYRWWSTNNGTQSNTAGPFSSGISYYGSNLGINIGRSRSNAFITNYTYNCFYIASGQNALDTFGITFSIMTTLTQIMNQFATDLGR